LIFVERVREIEFTTKSEERLKYFKPNIPPDSIAPVDLLNNEGKPVFLRSLFLLVKTPGQQKRKLLSFDDAV